MSWRDAIGLAVRSVRGRPGRAVLTVLAVALATALLTALLTISTTAETRVLGQLSTGGPLAGIKVVAAAPDPAQIDQDNATPGPPKVLDDAALHRIEGLPDVRQVVPVVSLPMFVLALTRTAKGDRLGPFVDDVVGVDVTKAGQSADHRGGRPASGPGSPDEVAVTDGYPNRLGLTRRQAPRVVGQQVELASGRMVDIGTDQHIQGRWAKVTIVGVVAQDAGDGQFLTTTTMVDQARSGRSRGRTVVATSGADPTG